MSLRLCFYLTWRKFWPRDRVASLGVPEQLRPLYAMVLTKDDLEGIREIIEQVMSAKLGRIEAENQYLKLEVKELKKKMNDMEDRDRRVNLVLHGVEEKRGESEAEVLESFVEETSKLSGIRVQAENIVRLHRLGRPAPGKKRPIIAKFISDIFKTRVLRAAKKQSKGERCQLSEDFSAKTRLARNKLRPLVSKAYQSGRKAFLNVGQAVIDNEIWEYDEENDEITRVVKKTNTFSFDTQQKSKEERRGVKNGLSPTLAGVNSPSKKTN